MFSTNSSLAEISVADRPARSRDAEPNEVERAERYKSGKCRDCERQRRPRSPHCTWCLRRVEKNTNRYRGEQGRRGPPSKADEIERDMRLGLRDQADAAAMIAEALKMPRGIAQREALKIAKAKLGLGIRLVNHVHAVRLSGVDE